MKILNYFKETKKEEKSLFNLLPDGVFILEQDGKIIDANEKLLEMYNITRFDILGRFFSDFVEDGLSVLNKIVSDGALRTAKAIPKNKQKPFVVELNVLKSLDTSKIYVCARNVTEREHDAVETKTKYAAAKKIIDEKNDFLLNSSGAILSNLVSVCGFSKAILDGIAGEINDKQKKYLTLINQNAREINYDLEKLFMLFRLESNKIQYNRKTFDLISLIKSINRIYEQDFMDRKIIFSLDYSCLTKRDCCLDAEIIEYVLRMIMDIFQRFANLGKCALNIGHPPLDFLKSRDFPSNDYETPENYVLFEAKITDLVFGDEELNNIFDMYSPVIKKRPIGLRASFALLKYYINDFMGGIWIYSKQNFGTMITFVLPLK